MAQAGGFTVQFLKDGSIKLTIDGEVPQEIHEATEMALDDLARKLGGPVKREHSHGHHHHHGHGHGHVHH